MADLEDGLAHLLTEVVDAESGYREGVELARTPDMVAVFELLRSTHAAHIRKMEDLMRARGMVVDDSTSALAMVHKTILNIRSIFSGLDENIVPGLIDGERRIMRSYDGVIAKADEGARQLLVGQRATLEQRVADLARFKETGVPPGDAVSTTGQA